MDTVTLVRSAIRGLLAAAGELESALRAGLRRDDDYAGAGKPVCYYRPAMTATGRYGWFGRQAVLWRSASDLPEFL